MLHKIVKQIVRKQVWVIKKKTVVQVLTPRCRRDGEPEYGRFTPKDIERIIRQAESHLAALLPYFKDLPNIGNYTMAYAAMVDLAYYRALRGEKVDPGYATNLIGDINWQFVVNTHDYAAAERLVEGGRYQREHTLSDGDGVCDMRWFIAGTSGDRPCLQPTS